LGLTFFDSLCYVEGESEGLRDRTGCRYSPGCSNDRRNSDQDALCIFQGETRIDGRRQVQQIRRRRGIDSRQRSKSDQHEFASPQVGVAHRSRSHFHDRVEEWSFFTHLLVPFSFGYIRATTTTVHASDEDDGQVVTACLAVDCSNAQPLVEPFTATRVATQSPSVNRRGSTPDYQYRLLDKSAARVTVSYRVLDHVLASFAYDLLVFMFSPAWGAPAAAGPVVNPADDGATTPCSAGGRLEPVPACCGFNSGGMTRTSLISER